MLRCISQSKHRAIGERAGPNRYQNFHKDSDNRQLSLYVCAVVKVQTLNKL